MYNPRYKAIMFLWFLFLTSCGQNEVVFDSCKWSQKDDIVYVYRENMVRDLMENHLEKDMTYEEVIKLLDTPEDYQNLPKNTICYEIMIDYGRNIDPQRWKNLYIEFTCDSTLFSFRLEEWTR
jgi:hypothetical protein